MNPIDEKNKNSHYIEFWENEYLNQIEYLLQMDMKKMFHGFATKEKIRDDWEEFLGKETSDFATGSERIFYWLFNQFGVPNSSPIGSDMFFETYNAFVHIDIKTVTLSNIGDFKRNIFIGDNQNSYSGNINIRGRESRKYKGNLPYFYTIKQNGVEIGKKVCLTYFIVILYEEDMLEIETILILSMPNGALSDVYGDDILAAGKNKGKIIYNYLKAESFKLLDDAPSRIRVLYWNQHMSEKIKDDLSSLENIYLNNYL